MLQKILFVCLTFIASKAFAEVGMSFYSFHVTHDLTLNDTMDKQQSDSLYAATETPQRISDQFSFTEGPATDKAGNVYFTDQPNDKIWKYDTDGNLSVYMEKTGRSNGMYFDNEGNLLSCADEKNQLWKISPDKKVTVLITDYEGKHLNGPNDLWVHPQDHIYFTDPHYKRSYWNDNVEYVEKQNVYLLKKGKKNPILVDDDLQQPNGIIGTPDGKYLYVADIKDNKTYKYDIKKDGTLSNRKLFVNQGSDGMTIDERGNIYLTGKGVTVYNPTGEKISQIDIPEGWTANVTFAGKDRDQLFITASKSVYVLNMLVKGVR